MKEYRFDKTAFKINTLEESDSGNIFEADLPYAERLRQAYYLISVAYGFSVDNPPRMDKTAFSSRKLENK